MAGLRWMAPPALRAFRLWPSSASTRWMYLVSIAGKVDTFFIANLRLFRNFARRTRRCDLISTDVNHFAAGTQRMPKHRSPLPLTAFEEYMFRDDRPAHPMNIVVRLRFSGALDRDAASVAWGQTIARHPLLRSTILATGNRRPCWVAADTLPPLCWTSDLAHGGMPEMGPIDLATEPGLRGWAASERPAEHDRFASPSCGLRREGSSPGCR